MLWQKKEIDQNIINQMIKTFPIWPKHFQGVQYLLLNSCIFGIAKQQYLANLFCIKQVNMYFIEDFYRWDGDSWRQKNLDIPQWIDLKPHIKNKIKRVFTFYKLNAIWCTVSSKLPELKRS